MKTFKTSADFSSLDEQHAFTLAFLQPFHLYPYLWARIPDAFVQ